MAVLQVDRPKAPPVPPGRGARRSKLRRACVGFAFMAPLLTAADAPEAWRPRLPVIAPGMRKLFSTSALAVTAAYAAGAVMMSLGADIAKDLIHSHNALVNGSIIAVFATVIAVVALPAKGLAVRTAIVSGGRPRWPRWPCWLWRRLATSCLCSWWPRSPAGSVTA
ncbi:hypothetical protein ACFC09_17535 [Streptomyces sp. NPDC056161]|uniref:hypothetical protein n=1 Tax=Streptomyces sp. NPDC056161 TaxID=3345732 RepID=UPI0035DB9328